MNEEEKNSKELALIIEDLQDLALLIDDSIKMGEVFYSTQPIGKDWWTSPCLLTHGGLHRLLKLGNINKIRLDIGFNYY